MTGATPCDGYGLGKSDNWFQKHEQVKAPKEQSVSCCKAHLPFGTWIECRCWVGLLGYHSYRRTDNASPRLRLSLTRCTPPLQEQPVKVASLILLPDLRTHIVPVEFPTAPSRPSNFNFFCRPLKSNPTCANLILPLELVICLHLTFCQATNDPAPSFDPSTPRPNLW